MSAAIYLRDERQLQERTLVDAACSRCYGKGERAVDNYCIDPQEMSHLWITAAGHGGERGDLT